MIGAIENGMIGRLKAASDGGVLGYRFRALDSYGGQFDQEKLNELVQYPAAYVVYLGDTADVDTGTITQYGAKFAVIVAAQNLRNEAATRHGVEGEPGAYQLIKDVRALLKYQTLGLDIDALAPGACRALFSGELKRRRIAVFAIEFSTAYTDDPDASETPVEGYDAARNGGLAEFETFHANWDVPPLGNVAADGELPDDDNADATDNVTLNT